MRRQFQRPARPASAVAAAMVLSAAALNVDAQTLTSSLQKVTGGSFSDVVIGTIQVGAMSTVSGVAGAAASVTFGANVRSLDTVNFSSLSLMSLANSSVVFGDQDPAAAAFSFADVGAGTYYLLASGSLTPATGNALHNYALLQANYSVTAVPEPEAAAMMLAGLGVLGFIVKRRRRG